MSNRSPFSALRWLSLVLILCGVALFILQLGRFSRLWSYFPPGLTIAGIPVGGMNRQQAAERILETYSHPVELQYQKAIIHMSPSIAGFNLDMESMLAAAEQERTRQPFWTAFWGFLWGQTGNQTDIPLVATVSETRLRTYLSNEISARYNRPPTPAMPVVGTVNFEPGTPGTSLEIDRSIRLIEAALRSTTNRVVELPLQQTTPPHPAFQNLEVLLKQTIDLINFDGLAGVYLVDMQNSQEIDFIYQAGTIRTIPPDLAFSASSTIKIPVMISVFRRMGENPDPEVITQTEQMIGKSSNPPADWLMENVIDKIRGPLIVTEDLRALGLQNTFLAGYFFRGAPLLQRYQTPANTRPDLTTEPDPYSQTTPTEIGTILSDLYQCAQYGGGTLIAVFPGEITQTKCKQMIDILVMDHNAVLIQAGIPDGTRLAHKHGWVTDAFGVMHDMSDAGIVYTPGGNYVLAIFLYHPNQLVWESASKLVADLSKAVYNFYNLPKP